WTFDANEKAPPGSAGPRALRRERRGLPDQGNSQLPRLFLTSGAKEMRSKSQTAWETAARCAALAQEADDSQEREHYGRLRDAWIRLAKGSEPFKISDVRDWEEWAGQVGVLAWFWARPVSLGISGETDWWPRPAVPMDDGNACWVCPRRTEPMRTLTE